VLLLLILGIGSLASLSVYMMTNAQATSDGSSTAKQMGICVVGAGGPCNGDSNWDGTHDMNGQCVLLNGCANNNDNASHGSNNNVTGK
jgi:hypothetical protein